MTLLVLAAGSIAAVIATALINKHLDKQHEQPNWKDRP